MEVKNLTTDWNDGIKVAAVVDAIAPGLCPEYVEMKPENALENASYAMKLAEDWLGVPMVSIRDYFRAISHPCKLQAISLV